ncbi:hypothetical protein L3Q82_025536, partial [Scortum barcoo]
MGLCHRPRLLPGAPIPKARLYSISSSERKAMEEYIETSLRSPASYAPHHHRPELGSSLWLLQQAKFFTKLDLQNAYHLVRIWEGDEWKTGFNTPQGHYEYLVMPFGLTNAPAVFQSFINEILCEYLNDFVFVYLDDILIFSPNLATHQRHVRQVLIRLLENQLYVKRSATDNRIHPCAFLSRKLTPAERNYDVGNKELLAVKVVLEEWRHWLEGAEQPFIVLTDHKNLQYLKSAKRLNSQQASKDSGGRLSLRTWLSTSKLALSVPGVRRRGRPGWGSSSHYRYHIDLGHTSRWTSSHGLPPSQGNTVVLTVK